MEESFLGIPPTPVPSTQQFICIGRLSEQKGQLCLVEASAIVARHFPQVSILLVGDGPMRPEIESAISRLGLAKNVILLGWKSGAEIR